MISLRQTFRDIGDDLPKRSLKGFLYSYLFSPSFRVLLNYRLGRFFNYKESGLSKWLVHYYRARMITKRGCDISYKAVIGRGVMFPHPIGIVIGVGVEVQDNVKIWQHVTLGGYRKKGHSEAYYPTIGKDVLLYPGVTVIGAVKIGDGAVIGTNAVVNTDIPDNCVAAGVPARIITKQE